MSKAKAKKPTRNGVPKTISDFHGGRDLPPVQKMVRSLWSDLTKQMRKADKTLGDVEWSVMASPMDRNGSVFGFLMVDGKEGSKELNNKHADLITSLCALSGCLPLVNQGKTATEILLADLSQSGNLNIWVKDAAHDAADVRLLFHPEIAIQFIEGRKAPPSGQTDWDKACRKRLVRQTFDGSKVIIEPGVNWFVEFLESLGCQTVFSCEGHPAGFHVVFEASYALAHELASVRSAEISVFRSLAFPGPNLWRLSLSRSPGSMEARNSELRRLSEQLVLVAQMMRRKELSAGSDKPGKKTKSVRQTKPRRRAA